MSGGATADMSVSLDGHIAGPNDRPGNGLGDGGEALHEWVVELRSWREAHGREGGKTGPLDEEFAEGFAALGASVIGRRMFDNAEEWGDDPPFDYPVFVLTHRPRESFVKGKTEFHFVERIEEAAERAHEAAGEKDVGVAGGQAIRQFLAAGLLDRLSLHVVPVLLGGGPRLFEGLGADAGRLRCERAIEMDGIAHLRFAVADRG